jgi:Zn-dependent protease
MEQFFPPIHWTNLLIIPGLLIGYTVHELGHALTAYLLGDTSQVERGKITLNPIEHVSWFGTLSFLLFGIGWPKPLQTNPRNLDKKYLGLFLVAIAGPVASLTLSLTGILLTLSLASAVVYMGGTTTDHIFAYLFPMTENMPQTFDVQAMTIAMTAYFTTASVWLTVTSLLPLPGLDGFTALFSLFAHFQEKRKDAIAAKSAAIKNAPPLTAHTPITQFDQQKRRNQAANIHFNVGVEYHQQHEFNDAIARYRQAIQNDEHFGPAYLNMGLAWLGKGKRKEAIHAFRGAIQFADDQKTQTQAWQQLHLLSEVSPVNNGENQESLEEMGANPWTDTYPTPNWLGLGVGSGLIIVTGLATYGFLITELVRTVGS